MIYLMWAAIWLVGAMITFVLDGLLNWSGEDDEICFWFSVAWPILIMITIIIGIPSEIRFRLSKARKEREKKEEESQRLRIAEIKMAEQEVAEYLIELEEDSKKRAAHL